MFLYGDAIEVPRRLSPEESEAIRLRLEQSLNALAQRAEQEFDRLYEEKE